MRRIRSALGRPSASRRAPTPRSLDRSALGRPSASRRAPTPRWATIVGAVSLSVLAADAEESYGPGAETFTAVGHFIFRNEAEAIGRKVAATRTLEEPLDVVEVTLESMPGAPGARGWSVVVIGKVPGGCHVVTVGLSSSDGTVYRVTDRRALPPKAPLDCERWFVSGGTSEATSPAWTPVAMIETPAPTPARTVAPPTPLAIRTATPSPARTAVAIETQAPVPTAEASPTRAAFSSDGAPTPTPTRVKRGRAPEKLTREEVVLIATELAIAAGMKEIEPKLSDLTGGRWRQDVIGKTRKGCAAYKIELLAPKWEMRYQMETTRAKSMGECREWYVREGRGELTDAWKPGRVDW